MHLNSAIIVLLFAAFLEVGGDALVRAALHSSGPWRAGILFALAVALLLAYALMVNAPRWNFGRMLGLYIAFFFVVAQVVSWLAFAQPPPARVLVGGALIVSGGFVIATAHP